MKSLYIAVCFLLVTIVSVDSVSAQSKSSKSKSSASKKTSTSKSSSKKSSKSTGRLPAFFGQLKLKDDQRTDIYDIQSKYKSEMDAMAKKLEELKEKQTKEVEGVLTRTQKTLLNKLRKGSSSEVASTAKSSAKKASSSKSSSKKPSTKKSTSKKSSSKSGTKKKSSSKSSK